MRQIPRLSVITVSIALLMTLVHAATHRIRRKPMTSRLLQQKKEK